MLNVLSLFSGIVHRLDADSRPSSRGVRNEPSEKHHPNTPYDPKG